MKRSEARRDADEIMKVLDLLTTACENICDKGQCHNGENCPMHAHCIAGKYAGTTSVAELFEYTVQSMWIEFLEFADECLPADIDTEDSRYWRDNF